MPSWKTCRCGKVIEKHKNAGELCRVCKQGAPIPSRRVVPLIKKLVEERHFMEYGGEPGGGSSVLASDVGLQPRRIHTLERGEGLNVHLDTVDKILMATGNWHLTYEGPEGGGFADYYGDNPAPPDKAHRAGSLLFLPLWHSLVLLSVLLAPSKKDRTFSKTTKCECGNEKTYRAKRCRECHDSKREKASPEQAQWIRDSKKFFVKHP
jgi:hypothetical protein